MTKTRWNMRATSPTTPLEQLGADQDLVVHYNMNVLVHQL